MSFSIGLSNHDYEKVVSNVNESTRGVMVKYVEDKEIKLDIVSKLSSHSSLRKRAIIEPVYVIKADEGDELVYKPDMMELNKKYQVTWDDEDLILIKTESEISIYVRSLEDHE